MFLPCINWLTDVIRTITTINTFKPQAVHIHVVFVAVLSYLLGEAMAKFLPSKGRIGRILNPGPVCSFRQSQFGNHEY